MCIIYYTINNKSQFGSLVSWFRLLILFSSINFQAASLQQGSLKIIHPSKRAFHRRFNPFHQMRGHHAPHQQQQRIGRQHPLRRQRAAHRLVLAGIFKIHRPHHAQITANTASQVAHG